MSKIKLNLPDKVFGVDTNLLVLWVVPGLVLMALLLTFLGVIRPKISNISEIVKQVMEVRKTTQEVIEKRKYFMSIDQNELNASVSLLSSGVMPEKNSYLLVKIIRRISENSGYQVSDFSVSLGEVKKQDVNQKEIGFEKVPVQLVLSGPKEKYLELIEGLEKSLPVLSIDSFDMKTSGEIATIDIRVSAYFQPESNKIKIETLSLKEMILSDKESTLLSTIKGFKAFEAENIEGTEGRYKPYERSDPFFIP
ncbi:MAG: GspMb/PilO family protein [Patescibacteria group bacterium]